MASRDRDAFEHYLADPAVQLMVAGCRKLIGTIGEEEWQERLAAPFDEAAFADQVRRNRLSLVAHKTLVRPQGRIFSPAMAESLARDARRAMLFQLQLSKVLVEVHRAFESAGIRHLFLKGPALNQTLFGEEALRSPGDLDVLIEPASLRAADACLGNLGFEPSMPREDIRFGQSLFNLINKDISYRREGRGPTVELHWRTDKVETIAVPGLFDWERHVSRVPFNGASIPVLDDERNCLYLCLHAAKHHWIRLLWLLDIAVFMKKRKVDPARLLALAGRHGLLQAAQEAVFLSRRVLGVEWEMPSGFARAAARARRRFQLAQPPIARVITYHGGLLYPGLRLKLKFWFVWALGLSISRIKRRLAPRPSGP